MRFKLRYIGGGRRYDSRCTYIGRLHWVKLLDIGKVEDCVCRGINDLHSGFPGGKGGPIIDDRRCLDGPEYLSRC